MLSVYDSEGEKRKTNKHTPPESTHIKQVNI